MADSKLTAKAGLPEIAGCHVSNSAYDARLRPSEIKTVRMSKQDSAFFYSILEGLEGTASYSTLDGQPGDSYRDIKLFFSIEFTQEISDLLFQLKAWVYELK